MFIYELLLLVGILGLIAMAGLGFAHGSHGHGNHGNGGHGHLGHGGHDALGHGGHGHGGHAHAGHGSHVHLGHGAHDALGHGHSGHGPGHAGQPASPGHVAHTADHAGHAVEPLPPAPAMQWLSVLSPLTLFGMSLGAGATGIALHSFGISSLITAIGACGGAVLFRVGVVGPIWKLVSAFESRPAAALDGALMQTAEAITAFNARGEGLVRLTVDGQSVDVLARVDQSDPTARIARGDAVRVESVDSHTNSVTISRL